nr:hypothetical protein Iba_scaffold38567CG0010 [Ipomoea batatas]
MMMVRKLMLCKSSQARMVKLMMTPPSQLFSPSLMCFQIFVLMLFLWLVDLISSLAIWIIMGLHLLPIERIWNSIFYYLVGQ